MRLLLICRWFFIFCVPLSMIITFLHITKSLPQLTKSLPDIAKPLLPQHFTEADEVQLLLNELFLSSTSLVRLQLTWNKLIRIWKMILVKFVDDACDLCHINDRQCSQSVDITRYINSINQSFYPIDNTRRPHGMGLYYDFDLKLMRSLNNSILSTDVTPCDYFHMFQLMIHVQIVLHEKEIDYFITKGTFIGSLRHHDVIPWDTYIDIFIPFSSVMTFKNSFKRLNIMMGKGNVNGIPTINKSASGDSGPLYRKDLVLYQYRNVHRVTSYKIFSIYSSRVNRAHYRWPKIDVFPYQQSRTHIFAFPQHRHNLGTMGYLAKTDVYPTHLRPLGPLLVPSPRSIRPSLRAMVRLGQSSVFYVCQGNTFLHRKNRASAETWRAPCAALSSSYPFVTSHRDAKSKICTEMLVFNQNKKQPLSLYKYKCDEHIRRTLG